jgi:hypothetical protein
MLPPYDCNAEADPCCDDFYIVAKNILDIGYNALVECMAQYPCPGEFAGYVSIGQRINDPVSDYMVVSLISIDPAVRSSTDKMFLPYWRATYQVRLLETGWPLPTDDDEQIYMPSAAEYAHAAKFSLAHAQVMYKAIANNLGRLNPFRSSHRVAASAGSARSPWMPISSPPETRCEDGRPRLEPGAGGAWHRLRCR